jgi:hypothetical protein
MKRAILFIAVLFGIAVLLPADPGAEADVMKRMNAAMSLFAERMETVSQPQEFITATNEMAAVLEEDGKAMGAIYREHAEWAENPPPEMAPLIEENIKVSPRYDMALSAAARFANNHPDHEGCQQAMRRLATAAYEMFQ